MTFQNLIKLIKESIQFKILIVEDNKGLQALFKQAIPLKAGISAQDIEIIDNASDAIIYIGENYGNITHYSLDYDLSYGEKGTQVAEFLSQQGNTGHNVWIHSGNVDSRDEFLIHLPDAKITPSTDNIDAISDDIKANLY
jgi:hypothetical protein